MPISDDDVIGAELDFSILAGRNLIPMDGTGLFKMGKLSTSDPYVTVQLGGGPFKNRDDLKGKTEVRPKTLNPEWSNASFKFLGSPCRSRRQGRSGRSSTWSVHAGHSCRRQRRRRWRRASSSPAWLWEGFGSPPLFRRLGKPSNPRPAFMRAG